MAVLRHRNFRLYWVGQLISLTGMWMQAVAGSWIVQDLAGDTFPTLALAVNNFAVQIPALLLMLYGGVMADRFDRRRIMVITQAVLMVLALVVGTLVAVDAITFWLLLCTSVFVGIATAFDMPAQNALVPDLVEPSEIPQAIAMNQVIFNGSRLLGPAVAGVMIAVLGLASAYIANGLSYIAVIASLLLLRLPKRPPRPAMQQSAAQAAKEGIVHVWRSPLLRSLMGLSGATTLFIFPCLAVLSPAFVREALHQGPGTNAAMFAASGAASLAGAFGLLWVPGNRRGIVMLGSIVTSSVALFVLATTEMVLIAIPFFGLLSLGMGLVFGLNMTTVQQVTPGAIRGRVMSVSGLMFNGVVPVSGLVLGALSELTGLRAIYGLCGVGYLLLAGWLLWRSGLIGHAPETLMPVPVERQAVMAGD